jgi:hypothetical protein
MRRGIRSGNAHRWRRRTLGLVAPVLVAVVAAPAAAEAAYPQTVLGGTPISYWRLGETSGTVAAAQGTSPSPGTYVGGVGLGAPGALTGDADRAAAFDGVDDEVQLGGAPLAVSGTATIEGWFFWEGGIALLRDNTSAAGWILAFDSAGQVAYRVGGTQVATGRSTASVRDGWHHIVLTAAGGATAWYLDGAPAVTTAAGAGTAAAALPWHVMGNGSVATQRTRGRADELAIYGRALTASEVADHFRAGRGVADTTPPAAPQGLTATGALERVVLDWADSPEPDLDGYDVYRATAATGPFTRINTSRLTTSRLVDGGLTGGTTYHYVVRAIDTAGNASAASAAASARVQTRAEVLGRYSPHMRYESQETYFADAAAEITDNFVAGSRTNTLRTNGGTILAAADPADPRPTLSLGFLGDPTYADGRAAAQTDFLDEANTNRLQDAQRLRTQGYADRVFGRVAVSQGRTWLQYWFFYYFNPQSLLGIGAHEGDWEYVQYGLDAEGAPEIATYGQHGQGEACPWAAVERTSAGVPVVYPARESHASYYAAGNNPRGSLPDDSHFGRGYQVRPTLDVVSEATPWLAWRGRWGGTSGSPAAPRRQTMWVDPARFHAEAVACTVAAGAPPAPTATAVPAPAVRVTAESGSLRVQRSFDALPAARERRPVRVVVTATRAGRPDLVSGGGFPVETRDATHVVDAPRGSGPIEVQVSALSSTGSRSTVVRRSAR